MFPVYSKIAHTDCVLKYCQELFEARQEMTSWADSELHQALLGVGSSVGAALLPVKYPVTNS